MSLLLGETYRKSLHSERSIREKRIAKFKQFVAQSGEEKESSQSEDSDDMRIFELADRLNFKKLV